MNRNCQNPRRNKTNGVVILILLFENSQRVGHGSLLSVKLMPKVGPSKSSVDHTMAPSDRWEFFFQDPLGHRHRLLRSSPKRDCEARISGHLTEKAWMHKPNRIGNAIQWEENEMATSSWFGMFLLLRSDMIGQPLNNSRFDPTKQCLFSNKNGKYRKYLQTMDVGRRKHKCFRSIFLMKHGPFLGPPFLRCTQGATFWTPQMGVAASYESALHACVAAEICCEGCATWGFHHRAGVFYFLVCRFHKRILGHIFVCFCTQFKLNLNMKTTLSRNWSQRRTHGKYSHCKTVIKHGEDHQVPFKTPLNKLLRLPQSHISTFLPYCLSETLPIVLLRWVEATCSYPLPAEPPPNHL